METSAPTGCDDSYLLVIPLLDRLLDRGQVAFGLFGWLRHALLHHLELLKQVRSQVVIFTTKITRSGQEGRGSVLRGVACLGFGGPDDRCV